jgi:hypothetical protein
MRLRSALCSEFTIPPKFPFAVTIHNRAEDESSTARISWVMPPMLPRGVHDDNSANANYISVMITVI